MKGVMMGKIILIEENSLTVGVKNWLIIYQLETLSI